MAHVTNNSARFFGFIKIVLFFSQNYAPVNLDKSPEQKSPVRRRSFIGDSLSEIVYRPDNFIVRKKR